VAGRALMDATGGIKPGELWYVGALSNVGKSWELARHAVEAVAHGWDVVMFSLEMGGRRLILKRIHQIMIGHDEPNVAKRKVLVAKWKAIPGRGELKVIDPSIESVIDNRIIESYAKPNTLLIVDHVGLMYTTKGNASIEDHSFAAAISDRLKQTALSREVPILAAAQLNASAEESAKAKNDTERKRPVLTMLAQSIALGQSADVVYFLRGAAESSIREGRMVKNRDGEFAHPWWLHFRPGQGSFTEITVDRARMMIALERDHQVEL
jgi:replicative DNA helicase